MPLQQLQLPSITSMSSENPFISPLGKLALSLGTSSDSTAAALSDTITPPQLIQRRKLCVVTLLRIIDNILDDPDQVNLKLRKIKVTNPAFHKRCGQWDGAIDYLIQCGFKMKTGVQQNVNSPSSRHLRLDEDDRDMLFYGREMLVQFTVLTLGVDGKSLPKCPTTQNTTDDDDAKLLADNTHNKSNHTIPKTSSSAPTVGDATTHHTLSRAVQNGITIEEDHSVVVPNGVVSDQKTYDNAHKEQAQIIIKDEIIESATIETKTGNTSFIPAATVDDSSNKLKELNQVESQSTEDRIITVKKADEEHAISDEMTNLLNEIEAELNDEFFFATVEDSIPADEEAIVLTMSDTNTTTSEKFIDASPMEDSISGRSRQDTTSMITEEEDDNELAMAIAMSLSVPASDEGVHNIEDDGNSSNNRSLTHEEDVVLPSQHIDLELPAMADELIQSSDTDKNLSSNGTSVAKQENGNYDNEAESPPTTSDEPNALDDNKDVSCIESDKVEEQNVASLLGYLESDTKSTSHEVSDILDSSLRASIHSEKTLQTRNTSIQPQDSFDEVTDVKENEEIIELDRPPAAADDQIVSQSHDTQSGYTDVFRNISIPEGEYASSNEDDAKTFRLGFELCHRSLFSIWLSSGLTRGVFGLSNLRRCREDEANTNDPVILIPLHLVYTVWTNVLGLQSSSSHSTNDDGRPQSGSMYSWIISNNKELSKVDNIPIIKLSMNIHTNLLSETNISVCNYVLNALREIEVIDIYGGNVTTSPSSDKTFFIGVERSVSEEYTNNHRASSLLSEPIIRECHGILAQIVYPKVLDQVETDDNAPNNNCDQTLLWYALHHAPRHLIAVPRTSDAKELLMTSNFIRARVHCMGYLEGTRQHCKDCTDLANSLSRSKNDWKRTQLHAADTKQEQCVMSPEDYDDHDDYDPSQQASELTEWKESRVKALCAMSNILREKVGQNSESNQDHKLEIGKSLQVVGESIGDIGVYRVEELEHYDEALQLKSEALGDKHEEVAETLFAMGCHHQRFQRSAFAQKCYEQALGIYKARLGYDDPRVSRVLHNIGVMYHAKNESSVAMKCFMKSLSIRKAVLGDDDISVAESYFWIGNIHREAEEFEAARECFVAAHRIKALVLGNDHPECADILHNIGVVSDDLGLYLESLSSFREALMIRRANFSIAYDVNEMSDICDTLNCIANVYRAKMDRQRALQFFEQSLKRRARIVSATLSDDEQVSILLGTYEDVIALLKIELKEDKSEIPGKIGSLLVEMGILHGHRLNKPSKALIYYQKALQIFKQMKDFKKIEQVLSHMASIHVEKADNKKALKCFKDVLVLQQKSLKGESLEIADTLHNIGNCEAKEGEFEKCLDTYAESLQIKKNILLAEHVSIAKTEHCIGLAHLQVGHLDKALGYFLASMKARRSLLGNDHVDVSFSLHSIGRIYFHQDKYEKAIDCIEQALKIKTNALHDRHISLAESQHLLGSLLIKRGDFSSALPLLKAALITYKDKKDCEVLKSDVLDLLATAYMNKGDNRYAILSLEQSLKIKTEILGPDDLACANVLMLLGKLKSKTENVNGALVAFKEVKRIQKQVYGKDHLKNAELLVEVAAVQNQLGNSDTAFRCYTEALRIRRAQLYINSPEIAEVLVSMGKFHQINDNHVSSVECFDEAVDIYSKKQNCPELADIYYLLGTSQLATDDDAGNGLASLEKCLQSRESFYGTNSDEWAEVAYDLGIAKLETDAEEGVLLLERFLQIARTSEKDNSERLSNALVTIGKIYLLKTRSIDDEAMELFDEALEMQKSQQDNELWVSEVLVHKGSILEARKQYLKSLVCYEESLKLRKSITGEDEVTADTMKRLGEIHRLRGSYDQALEQFESALDVYRMTVGNDHESVADTLHCLGYIHDSKNDSDKALLYHREGWNVRKTLFGKDHFKVASSLDDIAGIYQKLGDNVKAIRCLKEALRVRKLTLGNDDMEVATTLFGLGICCAAINETPKAMECYNRALEISSFDGSNSKLEAQALHQIGCVHASKCSYRDALQSWRTSLSKYREAGLADDHYMVACTLGNIEMAENVLSSG